MSETGRNGASGGEEDGGMDPGSDEARTPVADELGRAQGPPDDPSLLDRFKEFWLTSFGVEHRTSVVVLLALITVAGILTYRMIPREAFPEVEIPQIAVNTIYPGVSPADMEQLVTRPLEEQLNTISNLKSLTSTSVEGYSDIIVEFETSVDQDVALQKVREKVDLAKPDLPDDAEDPSIMEFSTEEVPIMQVNLSGQYGLVRLKEIGKDLQDRLEQIPSVLRVDLRGGLEREVKVDASLDKLHFYGLSLGDLVNAIRTEDVNIPGGSIDVGKTDYLVRVDGSFRDPSVVGDLVVSRKGGRPVYVRDVASVEFGFKDRDSYARLNGQPVVSLSVVKRSGQNIIQTADSVRKVVASMQPSFPPTTEVKITSDESDQIHMMVSSLENNIVSGLILIIGVLLFFLGLRTSIFVALSIPTSMLLSFLVLGALGVSLNMVVLFSLILALGMLVDNAIVIVENIYRYMEEGWDRVTAAKKATGEVAIPVIASTLTTLAAFTPLLFWPGMVGEFMRYLPLTLIVTLSSSLFTALVIIPTLCAMFLRLENQPGRPLTRPMRWAIIGGTGAVLIGVAAANWLTAVLLVATGVFLWAAYIWAVGPVAEWFMARGMPWILARYETALRWSLAHRAVVLGAAAGVFVATGVAFYFFNDGVVFFPEDFPPQQIWVDVDAPVGTRAEATDQIVRKVEKEVNAQPGVQHDAKSVLATTGGGGGGADFLTGGGPGGANQGRVTVSFVDFQDRWQDSRETLRKLQAVAGKDIAGADISVEQQQQGPPTGPPVNIEIAGEDPARIQSLSDEVIRILQNAPVGRKLVALESDLDAARPELSVHVDREKAAMYGLSTLAVGQAIHTAIQGTTAAKYRTPDDEYDIVVRLAKPFRDQLGSLSNLKITTSSGVQVPLNSVASWQVEKGYGTIHRKNMDRMATVSSDVAAGNNSNAVLQEVEQTLSGFQHQLPPGYSIRYTGQQQEQQEAQQFLSLAFLAALGLIALILISQFNSVLKPFIILTSVIMSTAGVLMALMVFRMPFSVIMSGVGVISLAGIVVNNAIVLIDYIDILRRRDGLDRREALVLGGKTRLRPVVLTAVTTALGLVPLAIGLNFDFFGLYESLRPELYWGGEQAAWWGPMAIVVIVGILLATVLTLVLVPVLYSVLDDLSDFFRRHFVASQEESEARREGEGPTGEEGAAPGQPRPEPDRHPPEAAPVFRYGEG